MSAKKSTTKRATAKKSTESAKGKKSAKETKQPQSTADGPVELKDGTVLPRGAAMGTETATGQALVNEVREVPKGADRGSKNPIDGDIVADDKLGDNPKPQGLQAEPAVWTKNGTVEPGTLPSPSGPMPVAASTTTKEDADKKLEDHRALVASQFKDSNTKLTDEQIGRMSRAEVQAVAHDRGYEMPDAGTRVSRSAFKRAQAKDEFAVEPKKE